MIVQVGSNDIYSDLKVKVEDTLRNYITLIDKIKEKCTNGIVVGILPILRVPNEKNRMAQMINDKVKTLCNSKGVSKPSKSFSRELPVSSNNPQGRVPFPRSPLTGVATGAK